MTVSELSDYITRRKKIKSQYLNEVQNGCTRSRIRIDFTMFAISEIVDMSIIADRPMGLPTLEKLPIKVGEFALIEFRLYFF